VDDEVAPEVKETEGPAALGQEAATIVNERDLPVTASVEEAVVELEASSISGEKVEETPAVDETPAVEEKHAVEETVAIAEASTVEDELVNVEASAVIGEKFAQFGADLKLVVLIPA
jgi:phage tail sheath gpL-like